MLVIWILVLHFVQWPVLLANTYGDRDSAAFALAGELLRQGGQPYVSYWDHKPPLVHLLNAAGLALSDGRGWGVWLVSVVSLLAAVGLAWATLRRCFHPAAALVGAVMFASSVALVIQGGNLTEQYVLPLQWGMALLLVTWNPQSRDELARGVGLGALAALAFLLRPNLIGAPLAVGLVFSMLLLSRGALLGWFRLVAGSVLGLALLLGATWVYLASAAALEPAWDQIFRYNFLYAKASWGERVRTAFWGVQTAAGFTFLLSAAGWVLSLWQLRRHSAAGLSPIHLLAVLWLVIELPLAAMAGRPYPHYFMALLPALALLAAVTVDQVVRLARPEEGRALTRLVMALLLGIVMLPVVRVAQLAALTLPAPPSQVEVAARYVRNNSAPDQPVLVWGGEPSVYLMSDRRPATRFIYAYPLLTNRYADTALVETFMADLRNARPVLIVDAGPASGIPSIATWDPQWSGAFGAYHMPRAMRSFYDWVEEHYQRVGTVGPEQWPVYRWQATPVTPDNSPQAMAPDAEE